MWLNAIYAPDFQEVNVAPGNRYSYNPVFLTKHIRPSDLSLLLRNILSDLSPFASRRKGPAWFTHKISDQILRN